MLLPLRGVAFAERLREDVRVEAAGVALVVHDLRKTSHADTHSQFKCRTSLPTSRPRRACATPSPVFSFQFPAFGFRLQIFGQELLELPERRLEGSGFDRRVPCRCRG